MTVDQTAQSFGGNHTYSTGGIFTITVSLDDGNNGIDTLTTTAVVQGVGLIDGAVEAMTF